MNKFAIASAKALQAKAAAHGAALPVSATATGIKIGAHSISMEWLVFCASILFFGVALVRWLLDLYDQHKKWKEAVDRFLKGSVRFHLEFCKLHNGPTQEFEEGLKELLQSIKYNQRALAALEKTLFGFSKSFRPLVRIAYGKNPVPDEEEQKQDCTR